MASFPEKNKADERAAVFAPRPRDTSGVTLTAEMTALTEELARNTHDVWAAHRLAEGWRYGPCRNERRKEHPGLVPYERLPDSEKEYDRQTALETLKLILTLGYSIHKEKY